MVQKDQHTASRTQRAFVSLARREPCDPTPPFLTTGFASLPPLPQEGGQEHSDDTSAHVSSSQATDTPRMLFGQPTSISRAHRNLDDRLRPFWSSLVPNQRIQIQITIDPTGEPIERTAYSESVVVTTDTQGYFQQQINISVESVRKAIACRDAHDSHQSSVTDPKDLPVCLGITAVVLYEATGAPNADNVAAQASLASDRRPAAQQANALRRNQAHYGDSCMISANTAIMRVSEPGGVRVLSDIVSGLRRVPFILHS